jgi:YD repeat-containing protein
MKQSNLAKGSTKRSALPRRLGKTMMRVASVEMPAELATRWSTALKARVRVVGVVSIGIVSAIFATTAYAVGPIPDITIGGNQTYGLYDTPEQACQAQIDLGLRTIHPSSSQIFLGLVVQSYVAGNPLLNGVVPYNTPGFGGWSCNANYRTFFDSQNPERYFDSLDQLIWMYPGCPPSYSPGGNYTFGDDTCHGNPQFWVRPQPKLNAELGCCDAPSPPSSVGHPINVANGNVFSSEHDVGGATNALAIRRFYNSNSGDLASNNLAGWRYGFSRHIEAVRNVASFQAHDATDPSNSSLYQTAALACTAGFAQIQSKVPNWSGVTANYANDKCSLSKGGVNVGTLPILFAFPQLPPSRSNVLRIDATRDDGNVVSFNFQGGVTIPPPGTAMRLQQIPSGYTLTDANDTVETYDSNGVLQTITSRAGVTQTMSYDVSGRLVTVTDSFGHRLTLSYDPQNRVISVTRQ